MSDRLGKRMRMCWFGIQSYMMPHKVPKDSQTDVEFNRKGIHVGKNLGGGDCWSNGHHTFHPVDSRIFGLRWIWFCCMNCQGIYCQSRYFRRLLEHHDRECRRWITAKSWSRGLDTGRWWYRTIQNFSQDGIWMMNLLLEIFMIIWWIGSRIIGRKGWSDQTWDVDRSGGRRTLPQLT